MAFVIRSDILSYFWFTILSTRLSVCVAKFVHFVVKELIDIIGDTLRSMLGWMQSNVFALMHV